MQSMFIPEYKPTWHELDKSVFRCKKKVNVRLRSRIMSLSSVLQTQSSLQCFFKAVPNVASLQQDYYS